MFEERKENLEELNAAVCLIIEKSSKFLFTRQSLQAPRGRGNWGFPGGHIESGESVEEAVKREAVEELGIEVELEKPLGRFTYVKASRQESIIFLCQCKIVSGEITPGSDVDRAEWVAREDFHKYPQRTVMEAIMKTIIDNKLIEGLSY